MRYTVGVDQEVCISSGKCVADLPTVFRFDDEEIAEVTAERPDVPADVLLEQARACPSGAIMLFDEDGEEVEVF